MSKGEDKPALIHDALLKIPQEIRFLIQGAMSNVLFLTGECLMFLLLLCILRHSMLC